VVLEHNRKMFGGITGKTKPKNQPVEGGTTPRNGGAPGGSN
jgi:hypothetical protein